MPFFADFTAFCGSLALIGLLPCFTPWHFSVFITN